MLAIGLFRDAHGNYMAIAQRPTLTRREYEVLTLIAEGSENQQVADELVVSVETARSRVKGILRKLSARDRTHAVSLAYRSGLYRAARPRPSGPDLGLPDMVRGRPTTV